MNAAMTHVVGGTQNCDIVLDDQGFYVRCFARGCRWVSERTHAKHIARQWAAEHDASKDETAAEYGTPETRREYAVKEATRIYREARQAAIADYLEAGGTDETLRAPMHLKVGEPLYDTLVKTVTAAAMTYGAAIDAAYAAYEAS